MSTEIKGGPGKVQTDFGAWTWNPYLRSYVPLSGKPVDTSGARKIVDELRAGTQERLAKLAEDLQSGKLSNLTQFSLDLKDELRNLYTSTHVIARGGIDEMRDRDWGMLGNALKEQYDYANSMVREIENGTIAQSVKDGEGNAVIRDNGLPELTDGFLDRVDMYTESAWGAAGEFEGVVRDREMELGSLERRVLGDSKVSCADCIELADRDFQPPGLMPDIGETECGPGCNCSWEFENQELQDAADSFGHPEINADAENGPGPGGYGTLYPDLEEGKSLKGSAESGNYNHLGRPGEVGGSGPGGGEPQEYWDKAVKIEDAKGSNPGGVYKGPDGEKYYVKFPKNPDQSKAEIVSQKVYQSLGIRTPQGHLVKIDGEKGVATKWVAGASSFQGNGSGLHTALLADEDQAVRIFVGSVATQNWDVVGTGFDNIVKLPEVIDKETGEVTNTGGLAPIDTGGSFLFRAQGGSKAWNEKADEVNTLLNGKNIYSQQAFQGLFDKTSNIDKAINETNNLRYDAKAGHLSLEGSGITKEQFVAKLDDMTVKLQAMKEFNDAKEQSQIEKLQAAADKQLQELNKGPEVFLSHAANPFSNNSATSVIRWMGANGYKPADAQKVFDHYGQKISPATIKTQLYAGKTGKGDLANINDSHASKIQELTNKEPTAHEIKAPEPPPVVPKSPFDNQTSTTALARGLGKEGYTFQQAKLLFSQHDAKIADSTLKIQLSAGKSGTRGAPAQLTEEHRAYINQITGKPEGSPGAGHTSQSPVSQTQTGEKLSDTKAGTTPEGINNNYKLSNYLGSDEGSDEKGYHSAVASHLEQQASKDPALKEQLIKISEAQGKSKPYSDAERVAFGAKFVAVRIDSSWGSSSTDSNAISLGLQSAVANKFGLSQDIKGTSASHQPYDFKEHYTSWGIQPPITNPGNYLAIGKALGNTPAFREYANKTYELTQQHLKEQGIKEVTIYRSMNSTAGIPGLKGAYGSKVGVGKMNPVSSFSLKPLSFGSYKFTLTAPAERIFSHANTGPGTNYEKELLLIGGHVSTTGKYGKW